MSLKPADQDAPQNRRQDARFIKRTEIGWKAFNQSSKKEKSSTQKQRLAPHPLPRTHNSPPSKRKKAC